jgi:hypothetical protein
VRRINHGFSSGQALSPHIYWLHAPDFCSSLNNLISSRGVGRQLMRKISQTRVKSTPLRGAARFIYFHSDFRALMNLRIHILYFLVMPNAALSDQKQSSLFSTSTSTFLLSLRFQSNDPSFPRAHSLYFLLTVFQMGEIIWRRATLLHLLFSLWPPGLVTYSKWFSQTFFSFPVSGKLNINQFFR